MKATLSFVAVWLRKDVTFSTISMLVCAGVLISAIGYLAEHLTASLVVTGLIMLWFIAFNVRRKSYPPEERNKISNLMPWLTEK